MEKRKIMDDNENRVKQICALNENYGLAAILKFLTLIHRDPTDYVLNQGRRKGLARCGRRRASMLVAVLLVAELLLTSQLCAQPFGALWAGSAKGSTVVEAGRIWALDHLLEGFTFRFTSKDHQLTRVGFRPGPEKDQVTIAYHDKNSDDPFNYKVRVHRFTGDMQRGSKERRGCRGRCSATLSRPSPQHVFVLRSFELTYDRKDHHIDVIEISERNGQLTVAFNDKNDDDPFSFNVAFSYLAPGNVKQRRVLSGSAVGSDSRQLTDRPGPAAICGFRLDFKKPDSHLKSFGVETLPDLSVHYADKNSDDSFDWSVCLAFF